MASVDVSGEEIPSDLLLGYAAIWVRRDGFSNTGTSYFSYYCILLQLTTVIFTDNLAGFFFLPIPSVWDQNAFLFNLLGGTFKPTAPSIIRQATAPCGTDF